MELPPLPPPDISPYDSEDINGPTGYAWYEAALRAYATLAVQQERDRCVKLLELNAAELLLHCGEMTARELRTVRAVLRGRAAAIRKQP